MNIIFHLHWINIWNKKTGSQGKSRFRFVGNFQNVSQSPSSVLHSAIHQWQFGWTTSSSGLGGVSVLGFCHSNRCVLVSHCWLNLLPNDVILINVRSAYFSYYNFSMQLSPLSGENSMTWNVTDVPLSALIGSRSQELECRMSASSPRS